MSICISCWLIAICLINQSPPSNSYAINSLMSRVTAHSTHINLFPVTDPKINCLAWWVSPAQRGVAETNTNTKTIFVLPRFFLSVQTWDINSGTPCRSLSRCEGAPWAFLCFEKVQSLHTDHFGLKWETVLIPGRKPNKRGLDGVTPTLRYQSRNMTRQYLTVFRERKRKKRILLFPSGKPLFSISSQHFATAGAGAVQPESD